MRTPEQSLALFGLGPKLGCGGGLLLREAVEAGAAATGLDHTEVMAELARERALGAQVVVARAAAPHRRTGN